VVTTRPLSPDIKRTRLLLLSEWGLPLDTPVGRVVIDRTSQEVECWTFVELGVHSATVGDPITRPAKVDRYAGCVVSLYYIQEATADAFKLRGTLRMWALSRRASDYLPVVLLRGTARPSLSAIYVEIRWHADGSETITICGLTPQTKIDEIKAAWERVGAIHEIRGRSGPQLGDGIETPEQVVKTLKTALATMRWHGTRFRIETLVDLLPWEKTGYYERVNRDRITKAQLRSWYDASPSPATAARSAAPNLRKKTDFFRADLVQT
jgi:hypothetical protein